MEQSTNAHRILVGKPDRKQIFRQAETQMGDNIKMNLRKAGCDAGDWIYIAQDGDQWRAYARAAMNLRVP